MNFINGMWFVRDEVTIQKAKQLYTYSYDGTTLLITAPTRVISNRSDTLNLPVLIVEFFSPINDVICCRAMHFAGKSDPKVSFSFQNPTPEVTF